MSQENVKILRRGIEMYNRRDIDGFLELAHADIEWDSAFAGLEGGTFKGLADFRAYFEEIAASWEVFELRPLDFQATEDKVLASLNVFGKGKASGVEILTPIWILFWMRDRKAYRGKTYLDRADALEAAGLAE
jgi:ketosteroid isomerase-like protein